MARRGQRPFDMLAAAPGDRGAHQPRVGLADVAAVLARTATAEDRNSRRQ